LLDSPPTESEKTSWAYVGIGVLAIYATIPFARAVRNAVGDSIGSESFLMVSVILVLAAGYPAIKSLRKRNQPLTAQLWLIVVLGVFLAYIYHLRDIPEEAIHVAQYGILGLLVYRALTHRMRDVGIYLAAALIVGVVGIVDEYIQWLVPSRYFDLRDLITNFVSGALAQLAIFAGLRPAIISGMPGAQSWRRLCYLTAATLVILALGFLNTPQRVGWYATHIPALSYLLNNKSMMVDYGYLYDDPDTGVFRSRFSREQLRQLDRQRGLEVAAILDRYIRGEGYGVFLSIYTVPRDAYAHEAGVHLFRRESHFDKARENSDRQGQHYNIAFHENQILALYFPATLKYSKHNWTPEIAHEVSSKADKTGGYESAVSWAIITRFRPWQVNSLYAAVIILLISTGCYLGRCEPGKRDKIT